MYALGKGMNASKVNLLPVLINGTHFSTWVEIETLVSLDQTATDLRLILYKLLFGHSRSNNDTGKLTILWH